MSSVKMLEMCRWDPLKEGRGLPGWHKFGEAGSIVIFSLKLDFILFFFLDHFRDLHLIPKPSPGSQFPSGHAGIGVIQRCEAEMERVRDGF